jgi:hypothetical protein
MKKEIITAEDAEERRGDQKILFLFSSAILYAGTAVHLCSHPIATGYKPLSLIPFRLLPADSGAATYLSLFG